jgi:regulator of nucleoside diphosphate kinase
MDLLIITETDLALLRTLRPHEALRRELDRAIVVSSEAVPPDVITMNSRVLYVDESTGERRSVTVVYPAEADASEGRVSVLAPVGAALLGLSAGQAIEWDFPDGRRRLRVEDVSYQPESNRYDGEQPRRTEDEG